MQDLLETKGNELYFDGAEASEIASRYGTPTYAYSKNGIIRNYRALRNAFKSRYDNFRLHYAIKANSSLAVLKILKNEGAGADCSNINEIMLALKAGFKREDLLYTGNYNSKSDLELAARLGITINLDDISLLGCFENRVPKTMCFRLNPGFGYGKFDHIITAGPNAKFGVPEGRIMEAYRKALEMGVEKFGIHMMTGSCVLRPKYFSLTTQKLFKTAGGIASELGINFEFINIGGGFGIPYAKKERKLNISKVAENVTKKFISMVEKYGLERPRLLIEPGRFIVGNAGILVSRVTAIKRASKTFVGTDAGMNTLLRPALYGAHHEILVANKMNSAKKEIVHVCGQICENADIMAKDRLLPKAEAGDILVYLNAGAYGFSMSSQYNGFPRPCEVLVDKGKTKLIRKRETFRDLTRNQIF